MLGHDSQGHILRGILLLSVNLDCHGLHAQASTYLRKQKIFVFSNKLMTILEN
jgi:hypothetical protein